MKVDKNQIARNQDYEARGVIARYFQMGHYEQNIFVKVPVYRFLTLDQGKAKPPKAVEFVRPAPVIEDQGEAVLDIESLREGDIVVHPGLVYRECVMFDNLMAAHMKALQTYKPKDIIEADKADAPVIDLGFQNFSSEKVTKKDHDKNSVITQ